MATETNPETVLIALEKTIKSVGRDIRKTKGGADKINRMAALVNSYSRLAGMCVEEEKPYNPYSEMVAQDEAMIKAKRQKELRAEAESCL